MNHRPAGIHTMALGKRPHPSSVPKIGGTLALSSQNCYGDGTRWDAQSRARSPAYGMYSMDINCPDSCLKWFWLQKGPSQSALFEQKTLWSASCLQITLVARAAISVHHTTPTPGGRGTPEKDGTTLRHFQACYHKQRF